VRPLDPVLKLDLEVVWWAPARPVVSSLIESLVESGGDPHRVIEAPGPR
jgi:hypothetical protein